MDLPSLNRIKDLLKNPGDHFSVKRTEKDRIVATAKSGDLKLSKVIYPSGRVVETKSYKS